MDISALPADVQSAARIDTNGEVSWPEQQAARAIEALTVAGHQVLGLDIRDYLADGTFFEVPWYDSSRQADVLQALARAGELEQPDGAVERRVLVTWR